jgi:hypothetical protein
VAGARRDLTRSLETSRSELEGLLVTRTRDVAHDLQHRIAGLGETVTSRLRGVEEVFDARSRALAEATDARFEGLQDVLAAQVRGGCGIIPLNFRALVFVANVLFCENKTVSKSCVSFLRHVSV